MVTILLIAIVATALWAAATVLGGGSSRDARGSVDGFSRAMAALADDRSRPRARSRPR
jgi:hypothetical protein